MLPSIVDEYDLIECLFHILENVTIAENQIMESLVEAYEYINMRTNDESSLKERESHKHGSLRIKNGKNEQRAFAFSSISENTVDFQYVANLLNASRYFKHKQSSNFDKASIVESNANSRSETKLLEDTNELGLVLMKLYRVCLNTTLNTNTAVYSPEGSLGSNLPNSLQLNSQYQRVYTVMTPSMLASLLKYGWEYSYIYASAADTSASSTQNSNVVWCTDPEIAVALFVNTPYTNGLVNNSKTNAISNQAAKPPEPPSATAAGSTEHDDEEEEYEADYEPLSPMKSSRQGYPASSPRKQSSLKPGNERTGSASYHGDRMDRNPKLLGAKFKLYDVIQSKSTLLLVLW